MGLCAGAVAAFLGAKSSPLLGGALLLGVTVSVATLIRPRFGFLLTVLAVPLERIGRFTNDSSMYTFSLMRVLGLLTLVALIAHWLASKRGFKASAPVLLYTSYVLLSLMSLSYTSDWFSGVRQSAVILGNLAFFVLVVGMVESREQARAAIGFWLASTFCIGLFTIYQWHNPGAVVNEDNFKVTGERSTDERFSTVLEDYAERESIGYVKRAMGPTSSPAVYAINVILALPFYFWAFRYGKARWLRWAAAAGAAVAIYDILLTNTRAAIITLAVAVALIVLTGLLRMRVTGIIAAVVLCAAVAPFIPSALYERVLDVTNYTVERSATLRVRLIYWNAAVDIFADHPILGIGVGNQSELPKRITEIPMPPNSSVHNEYLESLLETGLAGYPIIIAFMVCLYRRCRFAERVFKAHGDERALFLLVSARVGLLCVLFYAVQCDVLHFPLKGWWLSMGIVVVLSEIARHLPTTKTVISEPALASETYAAT
jgi:hypothetical protein